MLRLTKADVKLALGKSLPNDMYRKIRYLGNQPGLGSEVIAFHGTQIAFGVLSAQRVPLSLSAA